MLVDISDEELKALTTAINNRYDLDFTNYETKSLKRGFARLISKHHLDGLMGLWQKVLYEREFLMENFDDLTVNLTELFRNVNFWEKFRDDILEHFKTKFRITMFHAGCSSGEELYTAAIVLDQKGLLMKTKSHAVDLSRSVVKTAKAGEYHNSLVSKYKRSFENYSKGELKFENYFKKEDGLLKVDNRYKRHITFQQQNLVTEPIPGKYDIIFCRNVLIYFDEQLKMNVLQKFYDALNPDGFLIIGYYDVLPSESVNLFKVYDPVTRIYIKENNPI